MGRRVAILASRDGLAAKTRITMSSVESVFIAALLCLKTFQKRARKQEGKFCELNDGRNEVTKLPPFWSLLIILDPVNSRWLKADKNRVEIASCLIDYFCFRIALKFKFRLRCQ